MLSYCRYNEVCCIINPLYLCVLVVLLTVLNCPGGLQVSDVGEEQGGLRLVPQPHQPKVQTGHTYGNYGTLSKIK